MKVNIFNNGLGYVTDEVSTINVLDSNNDEYSREKWVTDLASISRGNRESKNPRLRYEKLRKEASITLNDHIDRGRIFNTYRELPWYKVNNGEILRDYLSTDISVHTEGRPSRPLEFLPIVMKFKIERDDRIEEDIVVLDNTYKTTMTHFIKHVAKHSFVNEGYLFTNMRTLINADLPYEDIPYCESSKRGLYRSFKAIRVKVPMFVFGQLMTHTMISKESQSDRVAEELDCWLPEDLISKLQDININDDNMQILAKSEKELDFETLRCILDLKSLSMEVKYGNDDYLGVHRALVNHMLNKVSQSTIQNAFKVLGYKREIWSRAIYYFKYKEMILCGWNNDPEVWEHLFLEREVYPDIHTSWVQDETRKVCEAIKRVISTEKD